MAVDITGPSFAIWVVFHRVHGEWTPTGAVAQSEDEARAIVEDFEDFTLDTRAFPYRREVGPPIAPSDADEDEPPTSTEPEGDG